MSDAPAIIHTPAPDHPGWMTWDLADDRRFNAQTLGRILCRKTADGHAVVRMFPELRHSNLLDKVHGGVTLAFLDVAMFAGAGAMGYLDAPGSVTVDLNTQFVGAGALGIPLDAEVEVTRATRRLLFLRGLVVQHAADPEGDHDGGGRQVVASFTGIIRRNVTAGVLAGRGLAGDGLAERAVTGATAPQA